MRAVLLAAGRGERLRPLTDRIPKALIPVAGRPLLDHWLEACERHGFDQVLVNTCYRAGDVESYLATVRRPIAIRVAGEKRLLGTAGTLRANWDFVAGEEVFLFAHADNYTDLDLGAFHSWFLRRRAPRTVLGAALFETATPETCGIVRLDDSAHVVEFHEKVADPPGNLANGAVYLGTPALEEHLTRAPRPFDFSTEVIPRLMGRILGYRIPGFLADIGTPQMYSRYRDGA